MHSEQLLPAPECTLEPTWRFNKIIAYIEGNFSSRIDLHRLADEVGLSRKHLSRMFRRRFGLTLRLYIMSRRMAEAQKLMLMTRDPLCEIALRCGMCDQAHFAHVFRELVGETPSRWREARAAALPTGDPGVPLDLTIRILRRHDPLDVTIDCRGLQAALETVQAFPR
jgi:AraC-like DNA-binding protein